MSTHTADTRPPQTSGPTWPETTANWSTHYSNDVSMFLLPAVIMHLTPCHMELLLTVRKGSKPYPGKSPSIPIPTTKHPEPSPVLQFAPEVSYLNSQGRGRLSREAHTPSSVYLHSVVNLPIFLPGLTSALLL